MTRINLTMNGPVAVLTLDGPESRNAIDEVAADEFLEACDRIDADARIGAAVICGSESAFCSGAHRRLLADASRDPAATGSVQAIERVYDVFVRAGNLGVPTVAAVRGAVLGAGVNLMLATDLRVVADDARIQSGFLKIGLHPGGGHLALLGRSAGREAVAGLGIFGAVISGQRAVEIGLAWESAPSAEVESRSMELARNVSQNPALARSAIRTMRLELGPPALPWPAALEAERGQQMWSLRELGLRSRQAAG